MGEGRRVTILTAAYQDGPFIGEALESALASSRDYLQGSPASVEMVIVNDGSTDETHGVIRGFMEAHGGELDIKYIRQPNQGQAASFQNALPSITGDVVCLLDADDRFLPSKISHVVEAFQGSPDWGMVTHPLWVVDGEGKRTGEIRPRAARLSHGDVAGLVKTLGRCVAPATSGLAFRRDLFEEIHPSPLTRVTYAADAYLTLAAAMKRPVCALKEPLGEYRQHGGSQYFERLTTPDGLARQVELQDLVARHLNLEDVTHKNSFFARNIFGEKKIRGGAGEWVPALRQLNRAIWLDPHFSPGKKVAFTAFWNGAALLPPALFWKAWVSFYRMQTGFRREEGH